MVTKSLKTRIVFSVTAIVLFSLAVTILFFASRAKTELATSFEENALNLQEATKNQVEIQYSSILFHREAMLKRRKIGLRSNTLIAITILESAYDQFSKGKLSEAEAKALALKDLRHLRYSNEDGYFWINDMTLPIPNMVMNPITPELDGKKLDGSQFSCVGEKNENLFKAAVEICASKNEGYINYLWPKPTPQGVTTELQPKISFVKLFKPWNWVLGTGVYIDDIEKDVQERVSAVIRDLNSTLAKQKVGRNGYFFIFNEKNTVLVHPNMAGIKESKHVNPVTGNIIFDDLKKAYHAGQKYIEYLWDKPEFEGQYSFSKKGYVTYYKPLGWYICITAYKEDLNEKVNNLIYKIVVFASSFLILALILSYFIAESISTPLNFLIGVISKTDKEGIPIETVPNSSVTEIQVLSSTINNMISSINLSRAELKESEAKFRGLIESSCDLIWEANIDGEYTYVSPQIEKILGYTPAEAVGNSVFDFMPENEANKSFAEFKSKLLKGEAILMQEVTSLHKNGEEIILDSSCVPIFDEGGKVIGCRGIDRDITERKKAEIALNESEALYETIFDSANDAILLMKDNKVISCNKKALEMFGASKEYLIGASPIDISSESQANGESSKEFSMEKVNRAINGEPQMFEWIHCREDKSIFYAEVSLNNVELPSGIHVQAVIRDITERKQAANELKLRSEELAQTNKELQKHKEHLEEMVKERTIELEESLQRLTNTQDKLVESEKMAALGGLVAGVAHEINTPVGIGVTAASHLEDKTKQFEKTYHTEKLSRKAFENYINTVKDSSKLILTNMNRAADLIQSFKQVAVDQTSSERRTFEMKEYMHEVLLSLHPKFKKTNFKIELDCPGELTVNSFPGALSQIMTNLLMNSLQHGFEGLTEGTININIRKEDENIILTYSDDGNGVDKDCLKKIFDPFFTTRRGQGGSGLGMHIVYNLVAQTMGGTISCSSELGEGIEFILEFPCNPEVKS